MVLFGRKEVDIMDKNEIALKIVLALIEKGSYRTANCDNNESLGETIAELYNAVLKSLND
jgi:hypothetical protein